MRERQVLQRRMAEIEDRADAARQAREEAVRRIWTTRSRLGKKGLLRRDAPTAKAVEELHVAPARARGRAGGAGAPAGRALHRPAAARGGPERDGPQAAAECRMSCRRRTVRIRIDERRRAAPEQARGRRSDPEAAAVLEPLNQPLIRLRIRPQPLLPCCCAGHWRAFTPSCGRGPGRVARLRRGLAGSRRRTSGAGCPGRQRGRGDRADRRPGGVRSARWRCRCPWSVRAALLVAAAINGALHAQRRRHSRELVARSLHRPPDRPAQLRLLRRGDALRAGPRAPLRRLRDAGDARPRPLQELQRPARPRRRQPAAERRRPGDRPREARRRHRRPLRRRGVRRAGAGPRPPTA